MNQFKRLNDFKTDLERMMQIAEDIKKEFQYAKDTGNWFWVDRDEVDNADAFQGPFDTFLAALEDAVEPYLRDEDEENYDN